MLAWILVYVPADKPYLCAQRNNCFEMIRNLKLKMLKKCYHKTIIDQSNNLNNVCQ